MTIPFLAEYTADMESGLTPAAAFRKAVDVAGGQTATANLLGKRQPAISKRLKAGKPAEPEEVLPLEAATGVSKHDLRPDIYPRTGEVTPAIVTPADHFEHAR